MTPESTSPAHPKCEARGLVPAAMTMTRRAAGEMAASLAAVGESGSKGNVALWVIDLITPWARLSQLSATTGFAAECIEGEV